MDATEIAALRAAFADVKFEDNRLSLILDQLVAQLITLDGRVTDAEAATTALAARVTALEGA